MAETAIKTGVKEGGWVVLQNLHHARSWLPKLSAAITNLFDSGSDPSTEQKPKKSTGIHNTFRLILTTQPSNLVKKILSKISFQFYKVYVF